MNIFLPEISVRTKRFANKSVVCFSRAQHEGKLKALGFMYYCHKLLENIEKKVVSSGIVLNDTSQKHTYWFTVKILTVWQESLKLFVYTGIWLFHLQQADVYSLCFSVVRKIVLTYKTLISFSSYISY